jgi:hypothetical protein
VRVCVCACVRALQSMTTLGYCTTVNNPSAHNPLPDPLWSTVPGTSSSPGTSFKYEVAGTHRLSRMSASFCYRQVDQWAALSDIMGVLYLNSTPTVQKYLQIMETFTSVSLGIWSNSWSQLLEPRIHAHKCSLSLPLAKSRNKVSVIELVLIVFLILICCSVDVFGRSKCNWHQDSSAWSNDVSKVLTLKRAGQKKPCRFRFPTKLCRFWQGFVVSDKALSFPTRLCRFRQTFVVSDKALSFLR